MTRREALARSFRRAGRLPAWAVVGLERVECLLFHRTVRLYGAVYCFDCTGWR